MTTPSTAERVCFVLELERDRVQGQASMSGYSQAADGRKPDQVMHRLSEYFHLP